MSTNLDYDGLESSYSQETCLTATTPFGPPHLQAFPLQSYPAPTTRTILEGYKFYKADPNPEEEATWACAVRTELIMKQEDLSKMIHKRAEDYSAEQQYKNLSRDQRAQVTQLTEDRRVDYPRMEWSCAYAKENYYANKARNPHPHNFETVSMMIILMGRPMEPTKYPQTPMGEYVDLRKHRHRHKGIGPAAYCGVQGPQSAPRPVRRYPTQGSDSERVVAPSVFPARLGSNQLPVYDNEHYGGNGEVLSDSHHDQRFPKPGEALPDTGSYQVLSQLPDQHQPSTSQKSRHPNFSPHYLSGSNAPSQKGTLVRNPDFVFSSTACKRDGDLAAPIPKRICQLHEMYQGYDFRSEGGGNRNSWAVPF